METNYGFHFLLLFASIINGAVLGLIYDLFRVSRMFFLRNKFVIFFEDLLFCFICAISFMILFYNFSNGKMRAFAFVGGICGFCAYYFTLGKFTKIVCEHINAFVSPIINKILMKVLILYRSTKKQLYTTFRSSVSARRAAKGFGLYKNGGKV